MANRVSFNALVDPITKRLIKQTKDSLGARSEGEVVDIWAALYRFAHIKTASTELQDAAANLKRLIKGEENGKRKNKRS